MNKSDALVVFSGGQDSTTCLFWAKKHFRKVYALSFIYGQKHVKEVELARAQGFSVDRDNFMAGLTVVAVPVFTASGRLAYTVVVVGLSSQLTTVATDLLAQEMMREAREISGLLVEGL